MDDDATLEKATILVVDDVPDNLTLMSDLLKRTYRIKVANNGRKALAIAAADRPDLILLDVMMPGMDGHAVCRELKRDAGTKDIPVIFLTARTEPEDEEKGFEMGAVDYIAKPISPPIVMARVATHLKLKSSADFLRDKTDFLELQVAVRTREIAAIQDVTIMALASLAETRDSDTGNHIRRTQHYVKTLAEKLKDHPRFAAALAGDTIAMLYKSAPLHDIGKVGIPDRILLKPGRLDAEEFTIMRTHAALGRKAIEHAESSLGISVNFLTCAKQIAHFHHENWDGGGYPEGIAGDDIPVAARLMALADVYDALISRRVYKSGIPHADAARIIIEGKGTRFDPDIVDAFTQLEDEFQAIAARFHDSDQDMDRKKEYIEGAQVRS